MPTDARLRLDAFYDRIIERSLQGCINHWTANAPELGGTEHAPVLVPNGYIAPEWMQHWPTITINGQEEYASVLDREAVEQAFTEILRADSEIELDPAVRRQLHLAEQEGDAWRLLEAHVDLVVQVAVFDRVVFA